MTERTRFLPRPALLLLPVVLVLPVAGGTASSTQAAEWRPAGLQGIEVLSLASTPDRLCAGTRGKGVACLYWNDVRSGWRFLGPDGLASVGLWVDPKRPDVMFTAGESMSTVLLYRSLDGGRTWESIGDAIPPVGIRAVSNVQGVPGTSTVYASGGSVYRSDDLGRTWRATLDVAYESSLEIAPTDPQTIWAGGDLAYAFAAESLVYLSRDGGASWTVVIDTGPFDYTPLYDLAAHRDRDGVLLAGFSGSLLRTLDHGATFRTVLAAPVAFHADWGAGGPAGLAFAAGFTGNGQLPGSQAFVSRDLGDSWVDITGARLGRVRVRAVEADDRRAGLAFLGTDDGIYAFFGAGFPVCHDARRGVDDQILWPGDCPPILSPGPVIQGDIVVADGAALRVDVDHIDLGAVHCVVEDSDIAFTTLDLPDPPVGAFQIILDRVVGAPDYGKSSDGLPRLPSLGDCAAP